MGLPPPVGGHVPPRPNKQPFGGVNPLTEALKGILADDSGIEDVLLAVGYGLKKFKKLRAKRRKR